MRHTFPVARWVLLVVAAGSGCDFDSSLSPTVQLEVVIDASGIIPHQNDLNYTIELERCRVAIQTLEFTTEGEMHVDLSLLRRVHDALISSAYAHPGHSAGGEVVGELGGRFVFDWLDDGKPLGIATMLVATYTGANFTFDHAESGSGVNAEDTIVNHTFELAGIATRDGETYTFEAVLDQDEGRRVVGLPLELDVEDHTSVVLGMSLNIVDPIEGDTVFDGIDFAALDQDGDHIVVIEEGTETGNLLRNNLQSHDFYQVNTR